MEIMKVHSLLLAGSLVLLSGTVLAQNTNSKQHVPLEKTVGEVSHQAPLASLLVINADGADLKGDKLVLTGVTPNSIVFADRPIRAAGHIPTGEIVKAWGEGYDSFEKDPPNATVSVLAGGSNVGDAVVTLGTPKLDGTTLTFDVKVLEGKLSGVTGPAALFIDQGHGWNNAGWYALGAISGAAIGANLSTPRYPVPNSPPTNYAPATPCPPGWWLGPWGQCINAPYHGRLPNGQWQ